jgi:hypothetical protein
MEIKMKKATLLLFLLFCSNNIFADSLRTQTMGQLASSHGAYHYHDFYNIFNNPAELGRHAKNFVVFEEGQAGYFREKDWNYGFYFGRSEELFTTIRSKLSAFSKVTTSHNKPLEFFLNKQNFGMSLTYLSQEGKPTTSSNKEVIEVIKTGLGWVSDTFDVWTSYYLKQTGKDSSTIQQVYEKGNAYDVGVKTYFIDAHQFAVIKKRDYSYGVATAMSVVTSDEYSFGFGKTSKSELDKDLVYAWGASYTSKKITEVVSDTTTTTGTESTTKTDIVKLPINFGVEMTVFDWLVLRAGANYNFTNKTSVKTLTTEELDNSSDVSGPNVGGTVKYKKLALDFKYSNGFDQSKTGNDTILNVGSLAMNYSW